MIGTFITCEGETCTTKLLSWAKAGKDSKGRNKATRSEGDDFLIEGGLYSVTALRECFVNLDPRAPIVGLRANTGARFENGDLPLALSLARGGALGLRGLEAYS